MISIGLILTNYPITGIQWNEIRASAWGKEEEKGMEREEVG